jgi:hypothetical protein
MPSKLKPGDRVVLNDYGLELCFGSPVGLSHMKSKVLTVIWVADESATHPEETYDVDVDDPDINRFLLHDRGFDLAKQ